MIKMASIFFIQKEWRECFMGQQPGHSSWSLGPGKREVTSAWEKGLSWKAWLTLTCDYPKECGQWQPHNSRAENRRDLKLCLFSWSPVANVHYPNPARSQDARQTPQREQPQGSEDPVDCHTSKSLMMKMHPEMRFVRDFVLVQTPQRIFTCARYMSALWP